MRFLHDWSGRTVFICFGVNNFSASIFANGLIQRTADHLYIQREREPNPGEWIWRLPDG
jgi:hypothetical protein